MYGYALFRQSDLEMFRDQGPEATDYDVPTVHDGKEPVTVVEYDLDHCGDTTPDVLWAFMDAKKPIVMHIAEERGFGPAIAVCLNGIDKQLPVIQWDMSGTDKPKVVIPFDLYDGEPASPFSFGCVEKFRELYTMIVREELGVTHPDELARIF